MYCILLIFRRPTALNFFNELGKYCALTVLFEKRASDERDESWKKYTFRSFNGVFLKGYSNSVDTAFCPRITKYVKDHTYERIICTNLDSTTVVLAIETMKVASHSRIISRLTAALQNLGTVSKKRLNAV